MLFRKYMKLEYGRLLLYGIHVGHSFKNSILFAAWFIFTYRQNIFIINLYKTLGNIKNGFVGIDNSVRYGNPVGFVNIERSTEIYVRSSAKSCGEFSYTTYGIHGMISNYRVMLLSIGKLSRYFEDAGKGTGKKLEVQGVYSRYTGPRSVFICNIFNNRGPSNECTVSATPCLGIVDTNVSGDDTNIATPGNDDSNDSIVFYNSYFSKYIIDKKYGNVMRGLNTIRKKKRVISFVEGLRFTFFNKFYKFRQDKYESYKRSYSKRMKENTQTKRPLIIKYKFPFLKYFLEGVLSFFGTDRSYNRSFYEALDIYEPENYYDLKKSIVDGIFSLHRDTIFLIRIGRFFNVKSSGKHYGYVRKRNLSDKIFRLRHLRGVYLRRVKKRDNFYFTNFILNRFNVNRFYKTFLKRRRFGNNKFVYRYLKYYYLNKYIDKLGLLKYHKGIFVKLSSFAHVSFTVCSHNYKDNTYSPFLTNLMFANKNISKQYNTLYKGIQFKPTVVEGLNYIINHNKINKNIKFLYIYKTFIKLKRTLYRKFWAPGLFWTFNFYLINGFNSRRLYRRFRRKRGRRKMLKLRNFKHIVQTLLYIRYFYKSVFFKKKFENFFAESSEEGNYNIQKSTCKYFQLVSKYYRKKLIKTTISGRYKRIIKFLRHFKKVRRYGRKHRIYTLAVIKGLVVRDMIKNECYGKLFDLAKKFRANAYMFNLFKKGHLNKYKTHLNSAYDIFKVKNVYYSSRYEKMNTMKLRRFRNGFKNFYGFKKLYNVYNKKYHRENGMNFFEVNKKFYNHEILVDGDHEKYFEDLRRKVEVLEENTTIEDIIQFLNKFRKSKKIKDYLYDKYNKISSFRKKKRRKHKNRKLNISFKSFKFLNQFKSLKNIFNRYRRLYKNLYKTSNKKRKRSMKFKHFLLNKILKLRRNFFIIKKNLKISQIKSIFGFFNYKIGFYKGFNKYYHHFNIRPIMAKKKEYDEDLNNKKTSNEFIKNMSSNPATTYIYLLNFHFYYNQFFAFKIGLNRSFKQKFYSYINRTYRRKLSKIYGV